MDMSSQIESILFVSSKPLSTKKIAKVLKADEAEVVAALEGLAVQYSPDKSGIVLLHTNDEWQLVSNPKHRELTENFVKAEVSGELTRPQLEALTVVAYCGPITKPELEQIRGVNCSLILRNLMMRGLAQEAEDSSGLLPKYEVTMEYLRHLGLQKVSDLPEYGELHAHEYITKTLEDTNSKIQDTN